MMTLKHLTKIYYQKKGSLKWMLRDWRLYVSKLNDLNPSFMNNIFKLKINGREVRDKYKLDLNIRKWNQRTFGNKSLKVSGPKIWNSLPYHVKSSDNLDTFKNLLKNWDGNLCKCNLCKYDIYWNLYTPVLFIQFILLLYWKLLLNTIYIKKIVLKDYL